MKTSADCIQFICYFLAFILYHLFSIYSIYSLMLAVTIRHSHCVNSIMISERHKGVMVSETHKVNGSYSSTHTEHL